jgi:hypothetical protein
MFSTWKNFMFRPVQLESYGAVQQCLLCGVLEMLYGMKQVAAILTNTVVTNTSVLCGSSVKH